MGKLDFRHKFGAGNGLAAERFGEPLAPVVQRYGLIYTRLSAQAEKMRSMPLKGNFLKISI